MVASSDDIVMTLRDRPRSPNGHPKKSPIGHAMRLASAFMSDAAASMTTIDLIYFNAGGGHRAAALALQEAIARERPHWRVRCIDLVTLLDPLGQFRRVTGFAPEDIYNKRLARGWTLGLAQELKLLQGMIRLGHGKMVQRLEQHWLRSEPDLAVSLIPNFNRALHESLSAALPGVPFVTVLTDMADHPPNFWMESPRGQHLVCGTAMAVAQAHAMGHAEANVHATSGMIIRPDFYDPLPFDRLDEFRRLGLDPSKPTGIVMFGGQGSMSMLQIARTLDDVQLILMCGRHQALAEALRAARSSAPRAIVDFTPEVRRHLQLADFFIGKPGPGSLSEAVHVGLPIVTIRNAWTMPQERFNADWVRDHELGVVTTSLRKIRPAVLEVLGRLDELKANVRRIENTAVFELPGILERILVADESTGSWSATLPACHDLAVH
jgi:1,2-diacylglycerol 3-beta-galactosyltransferase